MAASGATIAELLKSQEEEGGSGTSSSTATVVATRPFTSARAAETAALDAAAAALNNNAAPRWGVLHANQRGKVPPLQMESACEDLNDEFCRICWQGVSGERRFFFEIFQKKKLFFRVRFFFSPTSTFFLQNQNKTSPGRPRLLRILPRHLPRLVHRPRRRPLGRLVLPRVRLRRVRGPRRRRAQGSIDGDDDVEFFDFDFDSFAPPPPRRRRPGPSDARRTP